MSLYVSDSYNSIPTNIYAYNDDIFCSHEKKQQPQNLLLFTICQRWSNFSLQIYKCSDTYFYQHNKIQHLQILLLSIIFICVNTKKDILEENFTHQSSQLFFFSVSIIVKCIMTIEFLIEKCSNDNFSER